jgi:hypothetical protein
MAWYTDKGDEHPTFDAFLARATQKQNDQLLEAIKRFHDFNVLLLARSERLECENKELRFWLVGSLMGAMVFACGVGVRDAFRK